ncbi:histone-like nucleoid-structuring protein Lsr2 [Streptomyces sp. NPDC046876]|uniref:Lsr2 family DNA-binding protein n=1 Tax=Streptomyces sp. NPDC046876 TaxID=3155616 RepID=UPI0034063215
MTDISALTCLCPPSGSPTAIRWEPVEATLGMPLPADYKQLAETYGPGRFNNYLGVFHPHGVTEYVNLTGPMPARIRGQLHQQARQGRLPVPHDPDALFAIGSTDNGEYLFWITEPADQPDRWRITVNEARGPGWFDYDGNLTGFLTSILTGHTHVPHFPHSLTQHPPRFTPSHPVLWKPEPTRDQTPTDTNAIRTWAQANGYQVPPRGRIPPNIRQAWEDAHKA